jgi:hypothetical protein
MMGEDPTKIDMGGVVVDEEDDYAELSPYRVLSRGTTYHKDLPFEAPYITEILPGFYMGGTDDYLTLPPNIDYYLSLYKWGSYKIKHALKGHEVVVMYDAEEGPDPDQIMELAAWVQESRTLGDTLVCCQAGLNRSGLVVATALVLDGYPPDEAIALLREKRSPAVLCNQAFEDFVLELA